jgi:hypothetical protein
MYLSVTFYVVLKGNNKKMKQTIVLIFVLCILIESSFVVISIVSAHVNQSILIT